MNLTGDNLGAILLDTVGVVGARLRATFAVDICAFLEIGGNIAALIELDDVDPVGRFHLLTLIAQPTAVAGDRETDRKLAVAFQRPDLAILAQMTNKVTRVHTSTCHVALWACSGQEERIRLSAQVQRMVWRDGLERAFCVKRHGPTVRPTPRDKSAYSQAGY